MLITEMKLQVGSEQRMETLTCSRSSNMEPIPQLTGRAPWKFASTKGGKRRRILARSLSKLDYNHLSTVMTLTEKINRKCSCLMTRRLKFSTAEMMVCCL